MTVTDAPGVFWPTELQALLLKACLLDEDRALDAWNLWQTRAGLDSLDGGSYRLLPLLYSRLSRLGVEHPIMGRLKGIHRRCWSETRVLIWRVAPAVRLLEEHGIPTLMLKGVPLAALFYRDTSLRPMDDVDVLVAEEHAMAALDLLQANGWTRKGARWPREIQAYRWGSDLLSTLEERLYVQLQKGINLVGPNGSELDLHWHLDEVTCLPGANQTFWESAIPFGFEGISTRTLCPTDHLLHTFVHGLRFNSLPPVRWVADSVMIMRDAPIDWDRVLRLASELRVALPLSEGLGYVESFGLRVPAAVLGELDRLKGARAERNYHRQLTRIPPSPRVTDWIRDCASTFAERTRGRSLRFHTQLVVRQSLIWLARSIRQVRGLARGVRNRTQARSDA